MKLLKKYSHFVSYHPYWMLLIVVIMIIIAGILASKVGTETMDNKDTLPDDVAVIEAFDKIEENFGGSESIKIAIEINPKTINSNEVRDIRDPRVIKYINLLTQMTETVDDVMSVTSTSSILKLMNNDVLPKSKNQINELISESSSFDSYVSDDYQITLINIFLSEEYDEYKIVEDLQEIINQIDSPPGLKVQVAGSVATGSIMEAQIGPDMQKTSRFAMFGIILVLFLLFFSIRYALTPLTVIGVGIVWTFGFLGLIGTNLSSITSSAISMIMGIGIDFGIQTTNRFRQELKKNKFDSSKSMQITISNVFKPMATTTIAALIGFRAMMMGQLSIMASLAEIMSYGVFFCFLAAITIVPSILVIGEKIFNKKAS